MQKQYRQRARMITEQVAARGLTDVFMLEALRLAPRHVFTRPEDRELAYTDHPLSIGHGQSLSPTYVVARMIQALEIGPTSRVLEVGTGSGYQAAVLAEITSSVHTIEFIEPLALLARENLCGLGYSHVRTRIGDGAEGWPDKAPFDAIIVTAAPREVPQRLFEQLAIGGRMCIPLGPRSGKQVLTIIEKTKSGAMRSHELSTVNFVPMAY